MSSSLPAIPDLRSPARTTLSLPGGCFSRSGNRNHIATALIPAVTKKAFLRGKPKGAPVERFRSYVELEHGQSDSSAGTRRSHLRFRSFSYATTITQNELTLPKAAPDSPSVFLPSAPRLRLLWMSPGAVLNLALVSALRLGARRQETFGSSLAGNNPKETTPGVLLPTRDRAIIFGSPIAWAPTIPPTSFSISRRL
jgi:hypothetical protein